VTFLMKGVGLSHPVILCRYSDSKDSRTLDLESFSINATREIDYELGLG
jgi:hypothetical protein